MGVLVRFASTSLLLQREDFSAAFKTLKKAAQRDAPAHTTAAVAAARTLPELLHALELGPTLDAHGDLVGLAFDGDRAPPGAPDEFPENLVLPLKKLLRGARFDRTLEGSSMVRRTSIDRGVVRAQDIPLRQRHLSQIGEPPRLRVGETTTIPIRYVSAVEADDAEVRLRVSDGGEPLEVTASTDTLRPGEGAIVTVRVPPDRPVYRADLLAAALYGDGPVSVRGHAQLWLDPPAPAEQRSAVTASEVVRGSGDVLGEKTAPRALEELHRIAARVTNAEDAELARRIAATSELSSALEEAGFSVERRGGAIGAIGWSASVVPCSEAFLHALVRALAPFVSGSGTRVRRALEGSTLWVTFLFERGRIERLLEARG